MVDIDDTILNAGAAGENIFNSSGTIVSRGYNLSSDAGGGFLTATGDQVNTDPMLGPLQDNGGPTLTHALMTDSPAIDAGDPNSTPPSDFDQRGPVFRASSVVASTSVRLRRRKPSRPSSHRSGTSLRWSAVCPSTARSSTS